MDPYWVETLSQWLTFIKVLVTFSSEVLSTELKSLFTLCFGFVVLGFQLYVLHYAISFFQQMQALLSDFVDTFNLPVVRWNLPCLGTGSDALPAPLPSLASPVP